MEALGINLGFLTVFAISFIVVMSVLTIWVYNPVINILEQRKNKIAQGLEDAKVAAEARANAEKEAGKVIADAQQEANKRVSEASARAEKQAADIRAAAEAERKRIIEAAQDEAKLERERVLAELRGQIAAMAIAAANKVLGEALDEQRQRALIAEFFSGVKAGKVVVAEASAAGAAAEVTSALPLTADEQAAIKADLKAASVTFKVEPAIMGGLIIRTGDKIVDASVAGKIEGLRQALK